MIRVRGAIPNRTAAAWSAAAGDSLSYRIYDASAETLITDGPRLPLPGSVAPGARLEVDLEVALPEAEGAYLIYVSPIRNKAEWMFERGNDFLLAAAEVAAAGAAAREPQLTSLRKLAWMRFLRSFVRAFSYPLRTIVEHRSLIRSLVRRDIVGRYRGSYGGLFWTVVHPLLLMLTYWFVFDVVLRTRFGEDGRPGNFVLYFLAGMLPWLAFSEAVGRSPGIVPEHANFVKKLVFPVEILPVNLVFAGLFSQFFGVLIFLAGMAAFGETPPLTAGYLPLLLVPQVLLTMGLCWFLAGLGAIVRDLGQIIGFVLTVWFFVTPICYPESALPANLFPLYKLNPLFILVRGYRDVLLEASPPAWAPLGWLTLAGAMVFVVGFAWFYKLKRSFADLV